MDHVFICFDHVLGFFGHFNIHAYISKLSLRSRRRVSFFVLIQMIKNVNVLMFRCIRSHCLTFYIL